MRRADGEVLIRGPVVMREYFRRPDATAAALVDGWLKTGDLGRLDDGGRLVVTGRSKEIIVLSSGKNLYPEEIEAVYRKSPSSRRSACSAWRGRASRRPSGCMRWSCRMTTSCASARWRTSATSCASRWKARRCTCRITSASSDTRSGASRCRERAPGKIKRFEIERRVRAAAQAKEAPGGPALSDADRAWLARPELAPILEVIAQGLARPGVVADARREPRARSRIRLDGARRVADGARAALRRRRARRRDAAPLHRARAGRIDPAARAIGRRGDRRRRVGDAARRGVDRRRRDGSMAEAPLRRAADPLRHRQGTRAASCG